MKHLRLWLMIGLGVLCLGASGIAHAPHPWPISSAASSSATLTPATGMPWES